MRNLREKQLRKFYKSLNRQALAKYVWSMSYDYDYYKPREKEYCSMIENIVDKYDTDYINSCVTIKKGLSTM